MRKSSVNPNHTTHYCHVQIVRRFITVHTTSIQHSYVLCGLTVVCVCVLLSRCCHVFCIFITPGDANIQDYESH